jgi:hypothetical protein
MKLTTTKINPKPNIILFEAVKERLQERLAEIRTARHIRSITESPTQWEHGFNDALDGEITFLTELLDAIRKS